MTDQMRTFLNRAQATIGVAYSSQLREARRAGWVNYWGTPQNSTTARYRITDAGAAALARDMIAVPA